MKPCQLCGVKSWGAVSTEVSYQLAFPFLVGRDLSLYARCDNCGAVADKDLLMEIEIAPVPVRTIDPFEAIGRLVNSNMPVPETRTERLLRSVLQFGGWSMDSRTADDLVAFVRELEDLLDNKPETKGRRVEHSHDLFSIITAERVCMDRVAFQGVLESAIFRINDNGIGTIFDVDPWKAATTMLEYMEKILSERHG